MSVSLAEILPALHFPVFQGDGSIRVEGVHHDSRSIRPGWVFVAIPGLRSDGHDFIDAALEAGASAVVAQSERPPRFAHVPWVMVPDTRRALGPVAGVVYGRPTTKMALVGITGTNGKTTLTFLLESIVRCAGGVPGVIGTVSYRWLGEEHSALHTTPEASDLQAMFKTMADDGVTHAFIEASSHGLDLGRLDGCHFDIGVFTNLSRDHLDHHGTMEDYYLAKEKLFTRLLPASAKKDRAAVVNFDDPYGARLERMIHGMRLLGFGSAPECDVRPEEVSITAGGIHGTIHTPRGSLSIRSPLTGTFNLSNILAAIGVADRLRIPMDAVRKGIAAVSAVPGRLERIAASHGIIFVDYAHTPDALKNVLEALKGIPSGRIITVMGCGGDRDRTKRPLMGREAAVGSSFVVVTSDNPRTEDPLAIIAQVTEGVRAHGFTEHKEDPGRTDLQSGAFSVISDRREAIAWAVRHIRGDDILLVAGKGHETYQEVNGVRYPFDDREILREELKKLEDRSQLGGPTASRSAASPKGTET